MKKVDWALLFAAKGWPVFPLEPNGKRPLTRNGFKDATTSAYRIQMAWEENPEANIGIATGQVSGIAPLDVDVKNGAKGRESLASIRGIPPTLTVRTPSGGFHLYYKSPGPLRSRIGLLPGLDLKADGGYVVGPGSVIDGRAYELDDLEASVEDMPEAILSLTRRRNGAKPVPMGGEAISEGMRNETLASLAGTMRRRGMSGEEIAAALQAVNAKRCVPPLPDGEVEAIAASIARYPAGNGAGPPQQAGGEGEAEEEDVRPPGFTDDALALDFTERHAEDWRYVAAWGYWLQWDGARWFRETTLKAYDLARRVCREASASCAHPKIAAKVAGAPTVAAVERLARADRRHAATAEQWDSDAWLFNAPGIIAALKVNEEVT